MGSGWWWMRWLWFVLLKGSVQQHSTTVNSIQINAKMAGIRLMDLSSCTSFLLEKIPSARIWDSPKLSTGFLAGFLDHRFRSHIAHKHNARTFTTQDALVELVLISAPGRVKMCFVAEKDEVYFSFPSKKTRARNSHPEVVATTLGGSHQHPSASPPRNLGPSSEELVLGRTQMMGALHPPVKFQLETDGRPWAAGGNSQYHGAHGGPFGDGKLDPFLTKVAVWTRESVSRCIKTIEQYMIFRKVDWFKACKFEIHTPFKSRHLGLSWRSLKKPFDSGDEKPRICFIDWDRLKCQDTSPITRKKCHPFF